MKFKKLVAIEPVSLIPSAEKKLYDYAAFLPVARKMSDDIPVYLEDADETAERYSLILQCLEKRGLISIDYDQPLAGFNDAAYAAYPIRGSFALTARGQQVVELLEIQGVE